MKKKFILPLLLGLIPVYALPQLNVIAVWDSIDCYGGKTNIDIQISNGTAPYTYQWSNGSIEEDLVNIPAGNYIVMVTDSKGAQGIKQIIIPQPNQIAIELIKSQDGVCYGGTIDVQADVSGGNAPYTYKWNDSKLQTTETALNLSAGTYKVSVTDSKGCKKSADLSLQAYSQINVALSTISQIKCKGGLGSISINATGGAGSFSYDWETGNTSNILSSVVAGNYSVTATDNVGCSKVANFTLPESDHEIIKDESFEIIKTMPSCKGSSDAKMELNILDSTISYLVASYGSSNNYTGELSADIDAINLSSDIYYLNITDGKCNVKDTVTISDSDFELTNNVDYQIVPLSETCMDDDDGKIQLEILNSEIANLEFSFVNAFGDNGSGSNISSAKNLSPGKYQLTITDGNCFSYDTIVIEEKSPISISTSFNVSNNSFSLEISANGSNGNFSYSIDGGETYFSNSKFIGLTAGNYQVAVMDELGCSGSLDNFKLVLDTTSINFLNEDDIELETYPNPSDGTFMVHFKNQSKKPFIINVFDSRGSLVYSQNYNSSTDHFWSELRLSDLKPGIYNLEIINEETKALSKILIDR